MMVFPPPAKAAGAPESGEQADMAAEPQADGAVRLSDDVTGSMKREAAQVTKDLSHQARSLFTHTPLGWDFQTIRKNPEIRFMGYGDSSIDFELLIWIDIRKTARRLMRSRLYFALFDALKAAGIEIPFPQRDLHIRSGIPWQQMLPEKPLPSEAETGRYEMSDFSRHNGYGNPQKN